MDFVLKTPEFWCNLTICNEKSSCYSVRRNHWRYCNMAKNCVDLSLCTAEDLAWLKENRNDVHQVAAAKVVAKKL